ncbi:isoprenylcysteine carboxylmethyltransferase family protein [Domibacillus sp. DTU_2020_1001157_1_SI_ALB_TIR_016]|uniref:isoprenylcysteine carboxyl methyltransferase family protein n=1 Tax=Domibacillus sp. DTU_2020_1001157_1_SI_ALB_TIR_016 TaxID=3077789 RepID=UPI0028E61224|nr:isoprenylcysteine carboxylmethyltransferase family protein [Domibacillus sp. DTU_2020_1001157_1_SI_ALB_TIR_016]WNS80478.1 isoprenylcysteine carboxylmethyltransferase family protein [Domibacillus sp. DTU_2020_1001157_1_SI_ALB_TIR_016]
MSGIFWLFILFLCVQRISELFIAKRNEKWMLSQGAYEAGTRHYPLIVALHTLFFISLIAEVTMMEKTLSSNWPMWLTLFLVTQLGRVWTLRSLGPFWNTKIIVLPGAKVVKRGPYRWVRHPNYIIVTLEFIVIPLLFQAYYTAIIFTLLNAWMLSVRIAAEEQALTDATDFGKS